MQKWKDAAAVAQRQHLVIATWQLSFLGISDHALGERIRSHGWRRLGNGVVALPGTMSPIRRLTFAVLSYSHPVGVAQRVEQAAEQTGNIVEALVAVAMGAGPAVSGRSALWLHGITDAPGQDWLRLPAKAGHAPRNGVRLRYGNATGTLVARQGLPVVDVPQALKDVAGCQQTPPLRLHHELTKTIATADALRLVTLQAVEQRLGADARFVGAPKLRRAVADLRGELSHSATEKVARAIAREVLDRYGLALHPRPYPVTLGGRTVGEADLPVVSIKLDFEIDGPHHLFPAQREKDQLRDRWMRRASWEVERFPTDLVDLHPAKFAAAVDECIRFRLGK